jgi:hypothetical protein
VADSIYNSARPLSVPVSDRFTLNYWVVNGTNQVEATNGFKDELFGFTAKPARNITWTMNYFISDRSIPTEPSSRRQVRFQCNRG